MVKYQCWSVQIYPFAEKVCESDVNDLYSLPTIYVKYGFEKGDGTLYGIVKFEKEMSFSEVQNLIPRFNWLPYDTEDEMDKEWSRRKWSLENTGYSYMY